MTIQDRRAAVRDADAFELDIQDQKLATIDNETETAHVPAIQTILHSAAYPSHIVLPRVAIPE